MRSVIFDLDGTLVDSLPGIESSARTAIESVLPGVPMPDLKAIVGPPIAAMFARLWPDLEPEKMGRLVAAFRSHYVEKGCLDSLPFPGVMETLSRLQAAGLGAFEVLADALHLRKVQRIVRQGVIFKQFLAALAVHQVVHSLVQASAHLQIGRAHV